jgi:hypothetical protein
MRAKVNRAIDQSHVERSLAPHVDQAWAESFILELRLLEVDGPHIGAALSEVESHCLESGESALEAFGDPAEYVRCLRLTADEGEPVRTIPRSLVPVAVQMVGMTLINWGFEDWPPGRPVDLTAGHLVNVAVMFSCIGLLIRFVDPLMRRAIRAQSRTAVAVALLFMANTAVCVASLLFLDDVIWRVPAGWALTVGAASLAAGMWWAFTMRSKDDLITSPITSPFEKSDSCAGSDEPGRLRGLLQSHLGTLISMAMIPVMTLFSLAMTLVLYLVSPK